MQATLLWMVGMLLRSMVLAALEVLASVCCLWFYLHALRRFFNNIGVC